MTILIAGGTGTLGSHLLPLLTERQLQVRVLTRDAARARHLEGEHVEIVCGDLRDPSAVERAVAGAQTVISAVQGGFGATGGASPKTVDRQGNSHLIAAARAHAVEHFILVSIIDAASEHPLELWRMKYLAEQELKGSGLPWTIVRATAFMEWCLGHIGDPLVKTGKTRIFGRGNNPINFVSARDVARFVERSVVDEAMRGVVVEVAGPENLTFNQVARRIQMATGKSGTVSHVPLPMMRVMAKLVVPINPGLAREIQAGIFLDTTDRTADPSRTREAYPSIPVTSLMDLIHSEYEIATERSGR